MENSKIRKQNDTELREKYNPEGSQLRQIQYRELNILKEFDRICRIHNIDYWLDSGNLIGAVRHGGFIPWDDDIDVCVMKKDCKKLKAAMQKSLSFDYEYSEVGTESNYEYTEIGKKAKRPMSRLYDKKALVKRTLKGIPVVVSENLWLDIWLMEPGVYWAKKIVENTYGKCLRRMWNFMNDGKFKHALAVFAYPFTVPLKMFVSCWCKIFHSDTLVHFYGNAFFSIRKMNEIYPLSEIEYEGYKFKAPHDIDSYLRRIYGDYMEIPSEDKIETHNIMEFKVVE